MSFVIVRSKDGAYVADMRRSPNGASYTHQLQNARRFCRRDLAEADRCQENEYIVDIEDLLAPVVG